MRFPVCSSLWGKFFRGLLRHAAAAAIVAFVTAHIVLVVVVEGDVVVVAVAVFFLFSQALEGVQEFPVVEAGAFLTML